MDENRSAAAPHPARAWATEHYGFEDDGPAPVTASAAVAQPSGSVALRSTPESHTRGPVGALRSGMRAGRAGAAAVLAALLLVGGGAAAALAADADDGPGGGDGANGIFELERDGGGDGPGGGGR